MPYFFNRKKGINILFIHIPKTGGTSLEKYFASLAEVDYPLKTENLYGSPWFPESRASWFLESPTHHIPVPKMTCSSLQHMTYENLLRWSRKYFNIKIYNPIPIRIFTIVRNPYERTISDLFFFKFIDIDTKPYHVAKILHKYLLCDYDTITEKIGDYQPPAKEVINFHYDNFDNHSIPQWVLCAKNHKELHGEINYMKTETLNEDMKKHGFSDFDIYECQNKEGKFDYYKYLNDESINLINKYYQHDFELFDYPQI